MKLLTSIFLIAAAAFAQEQQGGGNAKPTLASIERDLNELKRDREADRAEIDRLKAELRALLAKQSAAAGEGQASDATAAEVAALKERITLLEQELVDAKVNDTRKIETHVYGDVNFESFQGSNSLIDPHAIELIFSAKPMARLRFFAEIELERASQVGGGRGGEILLEQGWVEFNINNWLRPRGGVMLVPFGYFNQYHFVTMTDHVDRPLINRVVTPTDWFDSGFGFTGQGSRGRIGVQYEAYLMNGLRQGISAVNLRNARPPFGADNNGNKAFAGQVRMNVGNSYRLSASLYRGHFDNAGRQNLTGIALDGKWSYKSFQTMTEYARFSPQAGPVVVPRLFHGVNQEFKYSIRPKLFKESVFGASFEDPRIELITRYDHVSVHGTGISTEKRWTFGVNYRPSENFVAKTGYQLNDGKGATLHRGKSDGFIGSLAFFF